MTKLKSEKQLNYKYTIKLDIEQDAWNWYEGCNSVGYGVDWKQRVSEGIYINIYDKTKTEAYDFLFPFLKQKYIEDKEEIDDYLKYINHEYEQKFVKACQMIVGSMGKPLYRNHFTTFITTFPRGPYNYKSGYLWKYIGRPDPISNFLHELSHFQFIHYWWSKPSSAVSKLNKDRFNYLKESLTVIIDEDFYPLIDKPDHGYEIHQEFRKELHEFWKSNKDFDRLVDFGLERLPDYIQ